MTIAPAPPIVTLTSDHYIAGGDTLDPTQQPGVYDFSGGIPKTGGNGGVSDLSWGADGFGFDDFLDIINPLQHLPLIGSVYRWLTNDEIAPAARIAGGTLFGGPVGLAVALLNNALESDTGKDAGAHLIAALGAEVDTSGGAKMGAVQVAQASPQVETAAPAPPKQLAAQTSMAAALAPAATAATAQLKAAMAGSQKMPGQLSPEAFGALMRSIGAKPMAQAAPATAAAAPSGGISAEALQAAAAEALPSLKRRKASMDLHRLLADHVASRTARGTQ